MDFTAHESSQPAPASADQQHQSNMNGITAPDAPSNVEDSGLAELSSLFDLLDLEGNGDLDFPEFKVGLTSIGANFSHYEATALFEAIDAESLVISYFPAHCVPTVWLTVCKKTSSTSTERASWSGCRRRRRRRSSARFGRS